MLPCKYRRESLHDGFPTTTRTAAAERLAFASVFHTLAPRRAALLAFTYAVAQQISNFLPFDLFGQQAPRAGTSIGLGAPIEPKHEMPEERKVERPPHNMYRRAALAIVLAWMAKDTQRLSYHISSKSRRRSRFRRSRRRRALLTGAESLPGAEQQVPQSHRRGHFGVERQDTFILSDQTSVESRGGVRGPHYRIPRPAGDRRGPRF